MKYVKTLMLCIVGTTVVTVTGVASATTITSPPGTAYTGKVHATSSGHVVLHNAFTTFECNLTLGFEVSSHGSGATAKGPVYLTSFSNCTGNNTILFSTKLGSVEIHHISGTKNGRVTWSGWELIVMNHAFNGTCIYTTNNTEVGVITGAEGLESESAVDVSATIPRTGGSLGVFCGSTGSWTGVLKVTSPKNFAVSA